MYFGRIIINLKLYLIASKTKFSIFLIILCASVAAYFFGRQKVVASIGGMKSINKLHSLPGYYGYYAAIWCALPGLIFFSIWLGFSDDFLIDRVITELPQSTQNLPSSELGLVVNDIKNLAAGGFVSGGMTNLGEGKSFFGK